MLIFLATRKAWPKKFFGALQPSLETLPTLAEEEDRKRQGKTKKLSVEDGLIQLPSPQELQTGWEVRRKNFPDTTEENVEKYLADKAPKALLKGSSLRSRNTLLIFNITLLAIMSGTVLYVVKSLRKNAQIMHHRSLGCLLKKNVLL